MRKKEKQQKTDAISLMVGPLMAKLGHKGIEWQLGPKPEFDLFIFAHCKHCNVDLKCQQSLFIAFGRKVSKRWELVIGKQVAATFDDALNEFEKTATFDDCICERLAALM